MKKNLFLLMISIFFGFILVGCDVSGSSPNPTTSLKKETGEFLFALNSDGESYVFIEYSGYDRYVSIPNTYNGLPVTIIAPYSFEGNNSIEVLIIPNTIIEIEAAAFDSLYRVTSITIPNSVTTIGENAFDELYSLESIYIPSSVVNIGRNAIISHPHYDTDKELTIYVQFSNRDELIDSWGDFSWTDITEDNIVYGYDFEWSYLFINVGFYEKM